MLTVEGINKRESFFVGKFILQNKIYINNILDSTIDYFSLGDVKCLKYYKNGVRGSLQTKYFSTEEKYSIAEYKSDKLDGKKYNIIKLTTCSSMKYTVLDNYTIHKNIIIPQNI